MKEQPILERKGKGKELNLNLQMGCVNGGQRSETKLLRDHTKCSNIFYDAHPKG